MLLREYSLADRSIELPISFDHDPIVVDQLPHQHCLALCRFASSHACNKPTLLATHFAVAVHGASPSVSAGQRKRVEHVLQVYPPLGVEVI